MTIHLVLRGLPGNAESVNVLFPKSLVMILLPSVNRTEPIYFDAHGNCTKPYLPVHLTFDRIRYFHVSSIATYRYYTEAYTDQSLLEVGPVLRDINEAISK